MPRPKAGHPSIWAGRGEEQMRRRDFVGALVGTAAGLSLTNTTSVADTTVKGRLKQGLWTIVFGAKPKLTFPEQCAVAKSLGAHGFDRIPARDWPILRKHGLNPLMVGPGLSAEDYLTGLVHPDAHERVFAGISAQIDLCAEKGVKIIGLTAGQRRGLAYKSAADNCVEICKRLAPKLEAAGVVLHIENRNDRRTAAKGSCLPVTAGAADTDMVPCLGMEDMVFGHWDWGLEVVERVASSNVKLLCDIYHLQIMDGDITTTLERDMKHIGHIHVGGMPLRGEINDHQELNWRVIAQTIADAGYQGYVCHEWYGSQTADPTKSILQAMAIFDV